MHRPFSHRSPTRSRIAQAILGVALATLLIGCVDASSMFTGRWKYEGEVLAEPWLEGAPVLAIGHFGQELTGVVRFEDPVGVDIDPTCPCAFLDHVSLSLNKEEFVSTSVACDGTVTVWELALDRSDSDLVLAGTVTGDGRSVPVRLVQTGTFIRDEDRDCPSAIEATP